MKKIVLSGIKPTGNITLGNYLGAIKNFVKLQKQMQDTIFLFFVADLHAITIHIEKKELRENIKRIVALYLACGLNPDVSTIFIQSEVEQHSMLSWIMESTVHIGELQRMIQFKEKKTNQKDGIKASLLTYPALMAADILLYDADFVPIGIDQKQHLELTKLIADRFNNLYGNTFKIPETLKNENASKIKGLQNPEKKMSKSNAGDNEKDIIFLLDDLNQIKNKIKSAKTDSDTKIYYDEKNKPGISNLLNIYSSITNLSIKELEEKYTDKSYKDFKEDLAIILYNEIKPIQEKYYGIINSKYLDEVLDKGRDFARYLADKKIKKVYEKVGLGRKTK